MMVNGTAVPLPAAALEEAKAYLRVAGSDEDALIGRLARGAAELCEQFTGQALLTRAFVETIPASGAWRRLGMTPVRVIQGVETLSADGVAAPLPAGSYAVDIDASGDGWVRCFDRFGMSGSEVKRVRVTYEAGLASDWTALPEALRQGVVRLAAHLFVHRDEDDGRGPPAAVTALWRPWRRMRL